MGRFALEGLDHVAIAVADVERSKRFYAEVLGLEHTHRHWDVPVVMTVPKSRNGLALFSRSTDPKARAVEAPPIRILHIAFRVDRSNFDAARSELAARGIKATFSDHEISHSIYFGDPDGHEIELTTYELDGVDTS